MPATFPIGPLNIKAGEQVFGPFPVGAGFSSMEIVLDIANLVAPCRFDLELAPTGGAFRNVATRVVSGTPVNRDGSPAADQSMHWPAPFGTIGDMQVVTTAATLAQVRATNSGAQFHSAGGAVNLYP